MGELEKSPYHFFWRDSAYQLGQQKFIPASKVFILPYSNKVQDRLSMVSCKHAISFNCEMSSHSFLMTYLIRNSEWFIWYWQGLGKGWKMDQVPLEITDLIRRWGCEKLLGDSLTRTQKVACSHYQSYMKEESLFTARYLKDVHFIILLSLFFHCRESSWPCAPLHLELLHSIKIPTVRFKHYLDRWPVSLRILHHSAYVVAFCDPSQPTKKYLISIRLMKSSMSKHHLFKTCHNNASFLQESGEYT